MDALDVTEGTIWNYLKDNSDNLTKDKALHAIALGLDVDRDSILCCGAGSTCSLCRTEAEAAEWKRDKEMEHAHDAQAEREYEHAENEE